VSKKELDEMNIEEIDNEKTNKKNRKIEKLEDELAKAKADAEHWKNEYYRAYADTQNLRKNLEKDHLEAMRYRGVGFIEELLPVLDSFHAVLNNEVDDPKLKNYLIGFQYIYRNMVSALENEGVKEIAPHVGDEFDPKTMNAVEAVEVEEGANKIIKVVSNGYQLHDRIIRPVNVVVSKLKEKEENQEINSIEA